MQSKEVYNDSDDENYLELFPNLQILNLSNTRLSSPTLSLDGNENLRELYVSNDSNSSYQLQDVTNVPINLQTVDVSGNAITEYNLFAKSGNSIRFLDLSNNPIEQFNDRNYIALTNLDISDCAKLTRLTIESEFNSSSSSIDVSNCAITKAEINSRRHKTLDVSDNNLTDLVISGTDSSNGLRTLYIQNNDLGEGQMELGDMEYSKHSFSGGISYWGIPSLTEFAAYGNGIYFTLSANYSTSTSSYYKLGSSIGSHVAMEKTCSINKGFWDWGTGNFGCGTWVENQSGQSEVSWEGTQRAGTHNNSYNHDSSASEGLYRYRIYSRKDAGDSSHSISQKCYPYGK